MIKTNMLEGVVHKLKNGTYIPTPSKGYRLESIGDRTKYSYNNTIVVDEETHKIVIDIFESYSTGKYSMKALKEYINKKYNIVWRLPDLILKNKFYIGYIVFQGVEYKHNFPTFISKELFDRVQLVRKTNNRYRLASEIL